MQNNQTMLDAAAAATERKILRSIFGTVACVLGTLIVIAAPDVLSAKSFSTALVSLQDAGRTLERAAVTLASDKAQRPVRVASAELEADPMVAVDVEPFVTASLDPFVDVELPMPVTAPSLPPASASVPMPVPVEAAKPPETAAPVEPPAPVEAAKPTETPPPIEVAKPAEVVVPVAPVTPADVAKPADVPLPVPAPHRREKTTAIEAPMPAAPVRQAAVSPIEFAPPPDLPRLVTVPMPRPRPPPTPAQQLGLEGKERVKHERCLAQAIYFEARAESVRGQTAVAQVVLNRAFSPYYPKDICSVVYQNAHRHLSCQFTFACDGKPEAIRERGAWARAQRIAKQVLDAKVWLPEVAKATHYHATYVRPRWVRDMKKMVRHGTHLFYRPRNWGDGSNEPGWGVASAAAAVKTPATKKTN